MNADKTQLIQLDTKLQLGKLSFTELSLLSARVTFSSTVYDLGFFLNSQLTMKDHVLALCRSCFWQLRLLCLVRLSLTSDTAKTLVHAFISSRLDYCNSLLHGVSDNLLKKLQAIQNAVARVMSGARMFDHITPVLRHLHWLLVRQRIKYKLAMTVYKCLHGLAPTYLAVDCLAISAVAGRRHLRSARIRLLSIPRTRTMLWTRSFAVTGPVIWNSLPTALRTATLTLLMFTQHLKTHLFG